MVRASGPKSGGSGDVGAGGGCNRYSVRTALYAGAQLCVHDACNRVIEAQSIEPSPPWMEGYPQGN